MWKIFATLIACAATLNLSALCCDEPACWNGAYISGLLGGGWAKEKAKFTNANYFNTLGAQVLGKRFDFKSRGFLGGGAIGYNYQRNCLVFGAEAGILGLNLKDSYPSPYFPQIDRFSSSLNWLAYVKLRTGFAYKCLLPFITGGWAGTSVDLRFKDTPSNINAHSHNWANGWTVGAGVDYKLNACFSIGVAYDYFQLQRNEKTSCSNCGSGVGFGTPRVDNHIHLQSVTARLTYLFSI